MSSSSVGLSKRPRSKSEKQAQPPRAVFGDFSSAYNSIAGCSPKLSSKASPESVDNAKAYHDHIPLFQSTPPPVSPRLPIGPPSIISSEIGTELPTLLYGPGLDRRVIHNINIRSPQSPPENAVTEDSHAHRRFASMTELTSLYHNRSSPLNLHFPAGLTDSPNLPFDSSSARSDFVGRRDFGPRHFEQTHVGSPPFIFPDGEAEIQGTANDGVSEDRFEDPLPPSVLLESLAQESQGYVEGSRSDMGYFRSNYGTGATEDHENLDAYEQVGEKDYDGNVQFEGDEEIEHDAPSLYGIQPNRQQYSSGTSSLAKYMWSPRGSLDAGSVFSADVEANPYVHSCTPQGPAGPPSTPLPQLPSQGFQNNDRQAHRDISTTTEQYSHSSESYGNTRNLLRLPQPGVPSSQNSARSFARLSIMDPEGSVHSRSLSEVETRELEDDIKAHLPPIGEANMLEEHIHNRDRYKHGQHHTGSLSISYLRSEIQAGERGPDSSQESTLFGLQMHAPREGNRGEASSGREGQPDFYDDGHSPSLVRSGTPPLLFGRRALSSNNHDIPESIPSAVRSNGRLVQYLAAAGLRGDNRLTEADAEDEDGDWETETGNGAFSRQFVQAAMAHGEIGSSYADNSDSGSLTQPKLIQASSAEHIVQYSPHARYSQNWTLLHDQESGNMVLAPDPQALTSAATNRSSYHHPSPLSKEHNHPLQCSPSLRSSTQASPLFDKSSRFGTSSVHSHQLGGREKITSLNFHEESPLSRAILSGFGTRTVSDGTCDEGSSRGANRKGRSYSSSAWLSTVDGDALSEHSDLSSGGGSFSKVTALGAKANVTGTPEGSGARQVGSSLADASSPIVASPPFVQHTPCKQNSSRNQPSHPNQTSPHQPSPYNQPSTLNQSSSLNQSSTATEPRRLSVPLEVFTRGSSTMAKIPPNTVGMRVGDSVAQFIPNSPSHRVHKQSPHLQASTGGLALGVESDDDYLVRAAAPSPRDMTNRTRSDSDVLKASTKASIKGSIGATETGQAQSQADSGYPGGLPYESMYGDFLREMRGDSATKPVRPPMRQRQYNRPIALAESPHLHRVPHLTIDEALARQKELSRAYLWGFAAVFPMLLLFGHGLLDGVMAWHTDGEVAKFRHEEKVLALWMGYGAFTALFVGLGALLAVLR